MPEDVITIPEQIARHLFEWESFPKLLGGPFGSGMRGHIEVQNVAAIMGGHQEHVEDLKPEGGTVNKSTETRLLAYFLKNMRHVCDGGLGCRIMYLLTLDSPISVPSFINSPWTRRSAPERILAADSSNQIANLLRNCWTTGLAAPRRSAVAVLGRFMEQFRRTSWCEGRPRVSWQFLPSRESAETR
ncbi:MAG: hypothetical protein U0R19_15565 [Bryobacteraceae bacterium]